jgi:hypothetical protein
MGLLAWSIRKGRKPKLPPCATRYLCSSGPCPSYQPEDPDQQTRTDEPGNQVADPSAWHDSVLSRCGAMSVAGRS